MTSDVPSPRLIIMDTDIGSDIDDALALLLLLHLPEIELLGITTVYGQVELRAKIARRILQAAKVNVPVVAGMGTPISSPMPIWHTDLEGYGILTDSDRAKSLKDFDIAVGAPGFLIDCVMRYPGRVVILAIGALTNLARALEIEPKVAQTVASVVFMGAGITYPMKAPDQLATNTEYLAHPSHNVRCDVAAAQQVFESELPIRVLTNDVTTSVWWDGESVQQVCEAAAPAETAAVGRLLRVWLTYRSEIFRKPITGTCPHDPLTAAEAAMPGRFVQYAEGVVWVNADGSTTFAPEKGGRHHVGWQVDSRAFLAWMPGRLLGMIDCGCDSS